MARQRRRQVHPGEDRGEGLPPAPDAAKGAWLRRVTFDLTGLPPTPDELDAFLKDVTPDAFATVIDRLLASPRFGEHWARHWLDGVRFGQTVPTADRYRSKGNPLTARVFANRVWQRFFGAGIVRTPNDFGLAGGPPTRPELLDALAHRFANEHKWSVKKLVREVALSRAYRQAAANEPALAVDAENQLVARVPARRRSYEQIVDNLNAVAGALTFGAPPRARNGLDHPRFAPNNRSAGAPAYRALYDEDAQPRNLFDGADPELITEARDQSVTAPQMLFLLNNPQAIALAGKVAKRAEALAGKADADAKLTAAYALLFARAPSDKERDAAKKYLAKNAFDKLCHVLMCSSEFTYLE